MAVSYLGFEWVYEGGHGYQGKHAYNPHTNEAISTRDMTRLRTAVKEGRGQAVLDEIMNKQQNPTSVFEHRTSKGLWRISRFRRMSGAYRYATQDTSNPSYFSVYGHLKEPYEGEGTYGWRSITTLMRPARLKRQWSLEELWDAVADYVDLDTRSAYVVWEKLR